MTEHTKKIAVITGCSSGFGMFAALELARRGYTVASTMRDLARADRLKGEAEKAGVAGRIDIRQLDVTRFDELPAKVEGIVRDHGRIDVLINNAGYALGGFAEDIQIHELRAQLDTNFFGAVEMTKACLPQFRAQKGGKVIMVSSISGLTGSPLTSSYSASKHALEGWTESARIEMRSLNIWLTLVEPGAFETDIWERNVKIGAKALSEESLNSARARKFADFIKFKLPKGDARIVARLIADVADDSEPNLRYLVGKDAVMRYWLQKFIPWKVFEKMVEKRTGIGV